MSRLPSSATIVLLLGAISAGCSGPAGERTSSLPVTSSATRTMDALDRLDSLGDAWFSLRTTATVRYRAIAPLPGQATGTHQWCRQLSNGQARADIIRICSRQDRLRLMWDPPDRWRLDVTTPIDRFTIRSGQLGSRICRRSAARVLRCHPIPEKRAVTDSGFAALFERPDRILSDVGADGVASLPGETIAGLKAECFAAWGPEIHVEWCYSADGILLSFLRGSGSSGWQSLEASSVS